MVQGVAYRDIPRGEYIPSASLYTLPNPKQPASLRFNFGPDFAFAPTTMEDGLPWPAAVADVAPAPATTPPAAAVACVCPPLRESERPLAWLLSLGCTHQEGDVVLMGRAAPACTSTTPPPVQPPPPAPTPASAPIPSAPTRDAPQAAVDGPVEQQPAPPPSAAATAAAAVVDGTAPVETADDPTVPMETADDPKPV